MTTFKAIPALADHAFSNYVFTVEVKFFWDCRFSATEPKYTLTTLPSLRRTPFGRNGLPPCKRMTILFAIDMQALLHQCAFLGPINAILKIHAVLAFIRNRPTGHFLQSKAAMRYLR